jgi:hypothetical protein
MIKSAIEKILSLAAVHAPIKVEDIRGQLYTNNDLTLIREVTTDSLKVHNLSGIVEYVNNNFDARLPVLIHVQSPTDVRVVSTFNDDLNRNTLIHAEALLPKIRFNDFSDIEQFNIMLQSCFVPSDVKTAVLQVVGNVRDEKVLSFGDDGTSQQVTAKAGVATSEIVKVPNPVILKPFRTFVEIDQPESAFVLRMKDGPSAALFEADGGVWKIAAIADIKTYLVSNLKGRIDAGEVVIIG